MSYSPPSIGVSGLQIPSYSDILNYLTGRFRSIYGAACYLGSDSADYQDIAVRALAAADVAQALQAVYLSLNPQTATGASLDLVGKLIGTPRRGSSYSSVAVTLTGTPGAVIVNGVARDVNGNVWNLASPSTIGPSGTVAAIATCRVPGNVTANPGDVSTIATPSAGWSRVTNDAAAIPGSAVEADSIYRARLMISQAKPSLTSLAGTAAAIAGVPGVTRSAVYENATNATDTNGNPAHSITCVVEGGSGAAIAAAIYGNRGVGCLTNGTVSVSVADPLNPAITMPIAYDVLGYVPVYVSLNVHSLAGFTSATQSAIVAAVASYLNSLGIGQGVVVSELYGAALTARPNPDQPLFSVRAISAGTVAAQTSGSTTSGSPTVTVTSATGIASGQFVSGPGIPIGTTVSGTSGTTITLSSGASATGSGVALSFFALGASDIAVAFNKAAQGSTVNVFVSLV